MIDHDELEAMRDEFRAVLPYRCADGYCGALDCVACYPNQPEPEEEDDDDNDD